MNLDTRFLQLNELLTRHHSLWRDAPFCFPQLNWQNDFPTLHKALLDLDDSSLAKLEQDDNARIHYISEFVPDLKNLADLLSLPNWPQFTAPLPERFGPDVPGRKWQQINAFSAGVESSDHCIDWCAGKSHLGRILLQTKKAKRVTAIERNAKLCQDGERYAEQHDLPLYFSCADVLKQTPLFEANQHVCALHACGDLHRRLLQQACITPTAQITLAPCCYQLTEQTPYQPLSKIAANSRLLLSRQQLHLAVEETVTSGARMRRQRDEMMNWRLGFDQWQRQQRQQNDYLATPSRPYSVLALGFEHFIKTLCEHHQLSAPTAAQLSALLQHGQQRWAQVQRLQLVRHAFRRALELWLICDRALLLQENYYEVELYQFCARELTPRNVLISAKRVATNGR